VALWACDTCSMELCEMCFDVLHRKGKRARHIRRARNGPSPVLKAASPTAAIVSPSGACPHILRVSCVVDLWQRGSVCFAMLL
jgi:hypothetical protein